MAFLVLVVASLLAGLSLLADGTQPVQYVLALASGLVVVEALRSVDFGDRMPLWIHGFMAFGTCLLVFAAIGDVVFEVVG